MGETMKVRLGSEDRWSLHGMTALVTGGTKGIGHEVVEELARFGARVYTCARNETDLESCLKNWKTKGFQVNGSICDVASQGQRENLMQIVSSKFDGKLNILVNNTGTNIRKKTEDFTSNEYATVMATNLESAYHLCQLAHPLLKASGFGSIIMMSSVCGVVSVNVGSVYGATKGAMNQLARNLACEWAKDNIRINSIAPWFIRTPLAQTVATECKERLHELLKEELVENEMAVVPEWKLTMEKSFNKMNKEVTASHEGVAGNCRCEMQTPECDAVGSTAVVAVISPDKIIVANCGDSRAVLSRNGKAVPLSSDHKPDRPDELNRIEEAGGRVIYWDGPRVLGVLAMSRAIGDNYLKPYVSSEPEVTITDRTVNDDCLVLASDGLWDVVSNETACSVARMCLHGKFPSPEDEEIGGGDGERLADKACSDASMLLTKLALARHSADNVSVVVINLRKDM